MWWHLSVLQKAHPEIKLQVVDLRNGAKRHQWRNWEKEKAIERCINKVTWQTPGAQRCWDPLRGSVAHASEPAHLGHLSFNSHPSLAESWAENRLHPNRLHLCSGLFLQSQSPQEGDGKLRNSECVGLTLAADKRRWADRIEYGRGGYQQRLSQLLMSSFSWASSSQLWNLFFYCSSHTVYKHWPT